MEIFYNVVYVIKVYVCVAEVLILPKTTKVMQKSNFEIYKSDVKLLLFM